jgi:DNA processing protein
VDERILRYWIGFNRAKGIGPVWFGRLIEHFGDVETAWKASPGALRALGLSQRALESLLTVRTNGDLSAEMRAIEKAGAWVVTLEDAAYPASLRNIPAPPLLYVKGTLQESDQWAISVIGTRRATAYGIAITADIVEPLARRGLTIISGLARGIDSTAHRTALESRGRTIAVLATGIDKVYPPEHRQLADEIVANGALISELPLGEPPERAHFAPRNRLISGLSLGTLVVEAAERSGTLMTVNQALEQGREVFAVPGNVLSPASKGPNALIQSGAHAVTSAQDLLLWLGLDERELDVPKPRTVVKPIESIKHTEPPQPIAVQPDNDSEVTLLKCLSEQPGPGHIDELFHRSGLPMHLVTSTLTMLELKGLVRQVGIMHYALVRGPR